MAHFYVTTLAPSGPLLVYRTHLLLRIYPLLDAGQTRFVLIGKFLDGGPGLLVLDKDLKRLYFDDYWGDAVLDLYFVSADLTGDGRPEIVVQANDDSNFGGIGILVNTGSTFKLVWISGGVDVLPSGMNVKLINTERRGVYALELLSDMYVLDEVGGVKITHKKGSVIKYVNGQFQVMDPKP